MFKDRFKKKCFGEADKFRITEFVFVIYFAFKFVELH